MNFDNVDIKNCYKSWNTVLEMLKDRRYNVSDDYNINTAWVHGDTSPACPDKKEIVWEYYDSEWKNGDIDVREKSKFQYE